MANVVCYTAIFGAYDALRPVTLPSAAEFVCFTDRDIVADGWDVRRVEAGSDPRRTARRYKTQPALLFPDAAFTLWVDGCLMPAVAPEQMIAECLSDADVATFAHPLRDCIYQEAIAVMKKRKDSDDIVREQMERYQAGGYPDHNGLAETGVMLRAQSGAMARLGALWWEQIESGSVRDQLSFNWCLWRLKQPWHVIPGNIIKHEWFDWQDHTRG